MKTQYSEIPSLSPWRSRERLAETFDSRATKSHTQALPSVLGKAGHPVGWMERTLLAVNTDRVFIEVSDPELRQELVAAYEAEGRDVVAASSSKTLLAFMEQLPVPKDFGDDIVIAEDDFPGTTATDLHRQLLARGWTIPVFTVSIQAPSGRAGVAF